MLCLNNVIDDFQKRSCCLKVKLTAEGEPAAGTAFLGPTAVQRGRWPPFPWRGCGSWSSSCLPPSFTAGRSPSDPTAEGEKRRKHTASCCVHLRVLGKARSCLGVCSLPAGCSLSLVAGDKLPGLSEPWFLSF